MLLVPGGHTSVMFIPPVSTGNGDRLADCTPGTARTRASRSSYRGCVWAGFSPVMRVFSSTSSVCRSSNPLSTPRSRRRLSVTRPAPTSRISENATCELSSAPLTSRLRRPPPATVAGASRSPACTSRLQPCSPGTSPSSTPQPSASSAVNDSVHRS